MCRLYGFRATEPTKVECTLVHAQNALMVQSRGDMEGLSHAHGWGVATYENGVPHVERQAWAAYHGEHFRRAAARINSCTVLAHVRRATVGRPGLENTHPFAWENWAFAHNGTLPNFSEVRHRMLDAMAPEHRNAIAGSTDSEHVFHMLLSERERAPRAPLIDVVRTTVEQIIGWCQEIDAEARIGLNVLLTDGHQLVGTRWGRTLHSVQRHAIRDCEICGFPHVQHTPGKPYHALVLASEPISHEQWSEVPERSVYEVTPQMRLRVEPLKGRSA